MIKEMTIVYAAPQIDWTGKVLLVKKDRPSFQKNRYNLPGGKIELGEDIIDSALRELWEETGLKGYCASILGTISGEWGIVHCVRAEVREYQCSPRKQETEQPFWEDWNKIANNPILLPNLRVVIPMMMAEVKGFKIMDDCPSGGKTHTFAVTVNNE